MREEAFAPPERRARGHVPAHPLSRGRRRLLGDGDGFLLVADGAPPPASPRPSAGRPAEPDADGVPVLPSWPGRRDLP
ncbi:hypothetical protein ACFXKH_20770 [Streptomyces caelestis]|uniref:hypothetical protein n=1 Tax=Streptomyces caelestis TaxID=36816 RepID=UPI0036BD6AE3